MPEVALLSNLFFAIALFLTLYLVARRYLVKKAHLMLCITYAKHGATFGELAGACPSKTVRVAILDYLTDHGYIAEVLFFKLDSDTGVYQLTAKGKEYYLERAATKLGL